MRGTLECIACLEHVGEVEHGRLFHRREHGHPSKFGTNVDGNAKSRVSMLGFLYSVGARTMIGEALKLGGRAAMAQVENKVFELQGVNHLALVCKDMARTVDFYTNVLGMPMIKTIDLPNGMGQHFFFDIGNGDSLAFFWFPNAPEATPGVAAAGSLPGRGSIVSGHGSMNHVALNVPADKIDEYYEKLIARGVKPTKIMNHDDSDRQVSLTVTPSTFVRSIYFYDPDGICLEFAAWTRALDPKIDVQHEPVDAKGQKRARTLEPTE